MTEHNPENESTNESNENAENTETVTREETTVEKPVLNDPSNLTGGPTVGEKETTVTETHETSGDSNESSDSSEGSGSNES